MGAVRSGVRGVTNKAPGLAEIIDLLIEGDVSRQTMMDASGFSLRYVSTFLKVLKDRKRIFISNYGTDTLGRLSVKLYTLGEGEDVNPVRVRKSRAKEAPKQRKMVLLQSLLVGKVVSPRRKPLASIPKAIREVATSE